MAVAVAVARSLWPMMALWGLWPVQAEEGLRAERGAAAMLVAVARGLWPMTTLMLRSFSLLVAVARACDR